MGQLNSDGSLDISFGTAGKTTVLTGGDSGSIVDVALQADGKIVVVGESGLHESAEWDVARLNNDGSLDTSFGVGGKQQVGGVGQVALGPDGSIVLTMVRGVQFAVTRLNSDGTLDNSFGSNGEVAIDHPIHSMAIQPDGKIVVAGDIAQIGHGAADFAVVRLLGAPVTVSGGQVLISATSGDDSISVTQDGANLAITASFLSQPMTMPLAGITEIRVYGLDGNDQISLGVSGTLGAFLDGQDGSDVYTVNFGNLPGPVTIADSGASGADALTINGTTVADILIKSAGTVQWQPAPRRPTRRSTSPGSTLRSP